MKVFWPLITKWLPSLVAVVRTACRSDPVPGSVIAIALMISPLAMRGSQARLRSSEAWCSR